jgi:putative polyhydroxyalkanoate system protein
MARIIVERPHSLGREAVRAKAEQLAKKLAREYDIRYRWNGDVLEFRRHGADGNIHVDHQVVRVLLNLGLLLTAFAPRIKQEIERTLDESL